MLTNDEHTAELCLMSMNTSSLPVTHADKQRVPQESSAVTVYNHRRNANLYAHEIKSLDQAHTWPFSSMKQDSFYTH